MRYILLIYSDESREAGLSEAEQGAYFSEYNDFTAEVRDAGAYEGGDALQPTATATTVRAGNGRTLTTDGPFAETKEQLGGFYIVDCDNLDEAIAYAAKIPTVVHGFGSVEVRPILEFE